ncbi:MAG: hypothetical protein EHM77_01005 [Planctomycetaceae bacterium]|nr:MAG: hypothetical protein EHM77_01005 [Planctomycetaceae bacterium]
MRFEIEPFEGATPIRFGMSEADVVRILGEPEHIGDIFEGDRHYSYGPMTIGFAKEDRKVMHVAFTPGVEVTFRGLNVFEPGAFEQMCKLDGKPVDYLGSIMLLELGIDFNGFTDKGEQKVVAVFPREELACLKSKYMEPFRIV